MPQCHHVGAGFARPKCIPIDFYNRMEMIWHNNIFATFDIGVFVFQIPITLLDYFTYGFNIIITLPVNNHILSNGYCDDGGCLDCTVS